VTVRSTSLGCAAACALLGCSTRPVAPELRVVRIEPARVVEGERLNVQISGDGFHAMIRSDLDEGTKSDEPVSATVGGAALVQLVLRDERSIEAVVPETLPPGFHDLVVATSDGRSASLARAFQVVQRCQRDADCDDGDPCTVIEPCIAQLCETSIDKDSDSDGYIDAACGGNDCDDTDATEHPGQVWFPDQDGDGSGDPAGPGVLACERPGPDLVANPDDCDDSDPAIFSGSVCDDADSCTDQDLCFVGVCQGVDTCSAQCTDSCAGSCGPNLCCIESCSGSCPKCEQGCSCDQTCTTDGACSSTCGPRTTCRFTAVGASEAHLVCAASSACRLECENVVGDCDLNCASGAACLLSCGTAASCRLACSTGLVDCGNGVFACNRACP
jgi:hypothetical protein